MNNLKKLINTFLLVLLLSTGANTVCTAQEASATLKPAFKVIGYLPLFSVEDGSGARFDFSKVTHINIAFINPDEKGYSHVTAGLSAVIKAAHAQKAKVLVSIGGGSAPAYYTSLLADTMRTNFIAGIVQLVVANNLDGVDVDLENERIDTNYESFVTELSAAMKPKNKLLTAAVATVYQTQYTNKALAQFNFLTIMSYDKTGPWNPARPGQHAPFDMAAADLDYWINTRGLSREKLNLGLPFYGYGFGNNAPAEISFADLISRYPGAENTDEVLVNGGSIIYYNGINTIKDKTALALQNAGGIMIWQLMQDAPGDNSLLTAINSVIHAGK